MNNTLKRSLWIQPSLLAPWTSVPQRQDVKCFSCQRSCQKMQEMKFSHTEWKLQFRLSVFMLNSWFSFVSCQTVQQCFLPTHQPVPLGSAKKTISVRLAIQCIKFRKVFYFFLVCCKMFVMVVINKLLHCCAADKWYSVHENQCLHSKSVLIWSHSCGHL